MKLATTTEDFSKYVECPTDIPQMLEYIAACGFRHVDVSFSSVVYKDSPFCSADWVRWVDQIAETGAKLGLDFVQAHSSDIEYAYGERRDYDVEMVKRQMQACQMLGIPGTVVHGILIREGYQRDFMIKNEELYRDLLKESEKTGVMVYTENSCTANSRYYYMLNADHFFELKERLDSHPLFGMCWDVGHAHIQKVDQYHEIVKLGKDLKAVHIHDNTGDKDKHLQPWAGNIEYDAIMMGLIDSKYEGYFTLESATIPGGTELMHRRSFEKDGIIYDKLCMLPLEFKMRSERFMYDTAKYMLETYDCFEE